MFPPKQMRHLDLFSSLYRLAFSIADFFSLSSKCSVCVILLYFVNVLLITYAA